MSETPFLLVLLKVKAESTAEEGRMNIYDDTIPDGQQESES